MSKLFRSALWAGLVAVGVAACGDDVTIPSPPITVSVAPNGVSLAVNATLQMTATVNAPAGTATTVTWSTSDATKATINATGLVTGVAAGSVAITACSTAQTNACGSATISVGGPGATPASISIASITNTVCDVFGSCSEVPVVLTNVAGQIQVHLNLDAGGQIVSSVEVLIDGVVACSQAFSLTQWQAAQAAAAAADSVTANDVVPIVCSFNTGAFDATTGVPSFFNGARSLTARVNLVGSAPVATPSIGLIFNNRSGFIVVLTSDNAPDANSAINPNTGLLWLGGSVTVNFVGVSYVSGVTIASATFNLFGKTISAVLTNGLGSVTLPETTTWLATNLGVGNYLSPAGGDSATVATAVLSNGTALLPPVPPASLILNLRTVPAGNTTVAPLQPVFLDNTAPGVTSANGVVQVAISPLLATTQWVNATTAFAAGNLGTPSLSTLNASTAGAGNDIEEGVDNITVTFFVTAANGSLSGASGSCTVTGLTAITTGSQLAATTATVSNPYRVRVVFTDALGNQTCLDLAPAGVPGGQLAADFTPPTGSVTGPPAGPPGMNPVAPASFTVTASDDASGFGALPLLVEMSLLDPSNTTTCLIGAAGSCGLPAAQPLTFDATGGPDLQGYYTTTITLVDQAGNTVVLVTARLYESDAIAPAFSGGISLPSLIAGATTNTFTATATDDLDLNAIFGVVAYPQGNFQYPSQTIGSWGPPLEQSALVNYAVADWVRCINAAGSFTTASGPPTGITLTVTDQALNIGTLASAPFGANAQVCTGSVGNIPPGDFVAPFFTLNAPNYGGALLVQVSKGGTVNSTTSATVTLTAEASVTLTTLLNPFTRVDFYYVNGPVNIKIGTGAVTLTATATTRVYTYTIVWDPDASVPAGVTTVVALGVDAEGDAVLTNTVTVTVVP
jgi:hypothetical protein